MQSIHYNATQTPKEEFIQLLKEGHKICFNWWFDKLDCSQSVRRQRVENISFEETLKYYNQDAVPIVVERPEIFRDPPYLEIGFHTLKSPSYFLWILIKLEDGKELIKDLKKK